MKRRHFVGGAAALGTVPWLASCGGGGGSAPAPSPAPAPAPAPLPPVVGPAWTHHGRDAQHTALSAIATQDLQRVRWSSSVDLAPQYTSSGTLLIHYGSPVVTERNTVVLAVKTGASNGFRVEGREGATGTSAWLQETNYVLPPHDSWLPSYNVTVTPQGSVVAPAAGGRVLVRDSADAATSNTRFLTFYGTTVYEANAAAMDATVFINTPVTSDAQGNLWFGYQVTGTNPAGLVGGGIARIATDGTGRFVQASAAAGDAGIAKPATNSAPALSADGATLYVAVNTPANISPQTGWLLALDSTTLATRSKVQLRDPQSGNLARVTDRGTSSPMVGPDGHVYFGVLENPFPVHNARGWMLHFNAQLGGSFAPGGFGWDVTPSVVPASLVPAYTGTSPYLIAVKYNNYEGIGTGDGRNELAVLDPGGTMTDPISGIQQMREVLKIVGPTFESGTAGPVFEWCINTMAVDPVTKSIIVNSEDGILYRWSLATNTLSQSIRLSNPLGAAYTPTAVGPDGTVYAISNAKVHAVGT